MKRLWLHACLVSALVMSLAACELEESKFRSVGAAFVPSAQSVINASLAGGLGSPFLSFDCLRSVQVSLPVDLVITAAERVRVDEVTIRLLDGTGVGGPMLTFPQPALTSRFGTTVILAGATRTFPFSPVFGCIAPPPSFIAADIVFVAAAGSTHHRMRVTRRLH